MCGPSVNDGGCSSCSRLCHTDNRDVRCQYYNRKRGIVDWEIGQQEQLDTLAGTNGNIPHMTEIKWHWVGHDTIVHDSKIYDIGYGNPGGCNDCLIDSLRQCLKLDTDPRKVREDLLMEFADDEDRRAKVTSNSYLNLDSHWQTLLRALFKHNTCGTAPECDLDQYCVVALYRDSPNNGLVVGNFHAPCRLVVMNTSDRHFDPCLPR